MGRWELSWIFVCPGECRTSTVGLRGIARRGLRECVATRVGSSWAERSTEDAYACGGIGERAGPGCNRRVVQAEAVQKCYS